MNNKLEVFTQTQLKKDLPEIRPGDIIKVYQKPSGEEKKKRKTQVFEGQVLAKKHGKGISATITVRKIIKGIGVEKIFPIHSPLIEKIEILKRHKTRRAKLYYLRTAKGRRAKLKGKEIPKATKEKKIAEETLKKTPQETQKKETKKKRRD